LNGVAFVELDRVTKRFGAEVAVNDVSLAVAQGQFVTVLGPSGCGKTTMLRCVAGLERPDAGEISIGGQLVASATAGVHAPVEARNIGMVFQHYAVWPHMTVFDNVAYGLRTRRVGRAEIVERTARALDLVGLASLATRYATKLSGGQRQRVALARAIVYNPRVVLFDEPLSNLDANLRESMRSELRRLQTELGMTSIYVTHDQTEALVMSDVVVVMDQGVIQQVADPYTIYDRPANAFVAKFIGVANLLEGTLLGRNSHGCDVEVPVGPGQAPLRLCASGDRRVGLGQRVILGIRPEDISLHGACPGGDAIEGTLIETLFRGSFCDCRVRVGRHEVIVQTAPDPALVHGRKVFLTFDGGRGFCLAG
jgi:iron(III) transport system ATP-binding protein